MDTNTPHFPTLRSESPYSGFHPPPPPPLPSKNLQRPNGFHRPLKSVPSTSTIMERSRSHSEVAPHQPRRRAESSTRPGPQPEETRHMRDVSHDSGTQDDEHPSPSTLSQDFGAYFRRLSVLPPSVRVYLSSVKVVEAARGILFALSQTHQAAAQYIGVCGDVQLSRRVNRVLYNAKTHVGNLVDALEAHEAKGEGADVLPVIETCNACVGAFKHVINILLQHIGELTERADVRLTRTFLLLIYGSAVELNNSWGALKPCLPNSLSSPVTALPLSLGKLVSPQSNRLKTIIGLPPNITLPSPNAKLDPPPTPFGIPSTPLVDISILAETDEPLFEKISAATTAALAVLGYISDQVTKSHLPGRGKEPPGTTMAKLKELGAYALQTGDVTKRLKARVAVVRERRDLSERKKFWEDTNAFVKVRLHMFWGGG
jgi:RAM signalling pathway protein